MLLESKVHTIKPVVPTETIGSMPNSRSIGPRYVPDAMPAHPKKGTPL
jgi:hypothetical protein